jgi:squalene cyclase
MSKQHISHFMSAMVFVFCMFAQKSVTAQTDKEVSASIEKARSFLKSIQRSDGAICDTVNRLFETWETILAATALYETTQNTKDPVLEKAIAFLHNNENPSGLICHNQKCRSAYCLETTSAYYLMLLEMGEKPKVKKGAMLVAAMQKKTGQWEIGNPDVREQKEFPSVTAFVLSMLSKIGVEPPYKKEAYAWLISKQTFDGDWGHAWEYYNCPAYALWPVMNILHGKAIQYIYKQQRRDGSWFFHDTLAKRETSPELQTALMLSALFNAGSRNTEVIDKAVAFLLAKQNDKGYWDGGFFPIPSDRYTKKEYVFPTALSLSVLNRYLHSHRKVQ